MKATEMLHRLANKHGHWQRVLAFVFAGLAILALLPNGGKFRYEYQKGLPWPHDDLVAAYDLPLRKPETQLTHEIQLVTESSSTYLTHIAQADEQAVAATLEALGQLVPITESDKKSTQKREAFLTQAASITRSIYGQGVVENDQLLARVKGPVYVVAVNKAKLTQPKLLRSIERTKNLLATELSTNGLVSEIELSQALDGKLVANLVIDTFLTNTALREAVAKVSPYHGMVAAGEVVIRKGERITEQKFILLESMREEYAVRTQTGTEHWAIRLGRSLTVAVVLTLLFVFLKQFRPVVFASGTSLLVILSGVLLIVVGAVVVRYHTRFEIYLVPFCLLPVVLRSFFDARTALFTHVCALLIVGFEAANGFEFIYLELTAGMMATFTLSDMHRRSKLVMALLAVFLTYAVGLMGLAAMHEGHVVRPEISSLVPFAASVALTMLAYPVIFIAEKLSGLVSDLTLLELTNTNHQLLRRLAQEAPGTFQHSLQVANLAESAAFEVGGNALMVRAGALFHDIGKLHTPNYFIENQVGGLNPHDDISFEESAAIIIGHVIQGVDLARKAGLPEPILDFIRTHHGTSMVQYFYRSYLREFPDNTPDRAKFTYPGPKPWTKEMALLMMADSVEAASRSMKEYTAEGIEKLVDRIIDSQLNDGQFDEADITLREINSVRDVLKGKLQSVYHLRTEYPT